MKPNKIFIKANYLLVFSLLLCYNLFSQNNDSLFHHDKKYIAETGPSSRTYGWWYIAYGFKVGENEGVGADLIYGKSSEFLLGYRFKQRITNWLHVGAQIGYYYQAFHLKQDSAKFFPNRVLHDREKLILNNLDFSPYLRITFHKKRGIQMGKVLDIGGYGGWTYRTKHQAHNKYSVATPAGGSKTDVLNRGLVYIQDYHYGLTARMGIGHVLIYANYRLSDMFLPSYIYPELSRISVGIEIGLHE